MRGMEKHGPCRHCGVTTTPLWRNGPPDKPVLCNACGSRWRTKGSLTNYTPLHAREPINPEELKVSRVQCISFKPTEKKLNKIKIKKSCGAAENESEMPYSDQNFQKILEVDTSNRSSSGSATSYSESCAHFGTTEASDLTGSAQSNVRGSQVPSKKRMARTDLELSPVKKLTQDLYTIMQEQQSSCLSSASKDLLYESNTPVGSFELGNGSILLRYPNPKVVEEESEASSLPIDNKSCIISEAHSGSASFAVHGKSKGTSFSTVGIDELQKCTAQWEQEHIKRDKSYMEILHILQDRDSPLGFINLKVVVNFEVLMRHMTDEEQQQLMKYLPSTDNSKYSGSLRTTLNSSQFKENLSYFQQLLQEGIFDSSISGMDAEEYRILERLALRNSSTSIWVQHYKLLKNVKSKLNTVGREGATAFNHLGRSKFTLPNRPQEMQNLHFPEPRGTMRRPKRAAKSSVSGTNPQSILIYEAEEFVDNDGTCSSPRTIFASPPECSSMLSSIQFTDDSTNHDLLVDAPCNNSSFPEAELLDELYNQKLVGRNNSSAESGVSGDGEQSRPGFPASSFKGQKTRHR